MPPRASAPVIPFVGAALPYRRKYYTLNQQLGGVAQGNGAAVDVSPTGNKIFAYGWLRAHTVRVSTATAASSGGTVGQFGIPAGRSYSAAPTSAGGTHASRRNTAHGAPSMTRFFCRRIRRRQHRRQS